jgi:hypothetical protein
MKIQKQTIMKQHKLNINQTSMTLSMIKIEESIKLLYDYRINYTFASHLIDTELVSTLSNTELKYFLLNL